MIKKKKTEKDHAVLKKIPAQVKKCLFKPSRWQHEGWLEAAVLVNLSTGAYYTINRTVEKIWLSINGKRTIEGIAAAMTKKFSVDKGKLIPDIIQTLHVLERNGLIYWKKEIRAK